MPHSDEPHVMPVNDLVEHVFTGCVCLPTATPDEREDGSIGWIHVHHSLDGRELLE